MKKLHFRSLLIFLCLQVGLCRADFTAILDAGQLTSEGAAPMQVDNTSPSTNGSLLLLIDLGSSNAINNALTAGNYVAGTNTILAAGGFNNDGGTNETLNAFQIIGTPNAGDHIALRWFPQITYAQYQAGALPAAGDYFGTYDPSGLNPDGGDKWLVPSAGSEIDLNFLTSNSDLGGSQPPSSGVAGSQIAGGSISFATWQSTHFTTQQLTEPTVSGAGATPLNDEVPNLLKYLFDINPNLPMSTADRAALPTFMFASTGDLTLTYRQWTSETGITINVQTSSDLKTWTTATQVTTPTAGSYTLLPTGTTDSLTGDPYMEIDFKPVGTLSREFIRLSVTMP